MEEEQTKDEVEAKPVAGLSASATFCRTMCDMICERDVVIIKDMQMDALAKFEKNNDKFDKFNRLSADRYNRLYNHFQSHTKMLMEMKKDLDIVFRRIRNLRSKLTKQYGQSFMATSRNIHKLEEELEADAGVAFKEEKPQTQEYTSQNVGSIEGKTTEQNSPDTENTTPKANPGMSSLEEQVVEHTRTVYSTTLRPQLSSSDDSYGSTDSDDMQDKAEQSPESTESNDNIMLDKTQQSPESSKETETSNETSNTRVSSDICSQRDDSQNTQLSSTDDSLESDSEEEKTTESHPTESEQSEKINL